MKFAANIIACLLAGSQAVYGTETCWKKLATRGMGTVPTDCPQGMVNEGGFCFTPCIEGYYSFLNMCFKDLHCPSPWVEFLTDCVKPLPYNRWPCWGSAGCKQIGWFYYPECSEGYRDEGTWCMYGCPDGMTDNGLSCAP